MKKHNFNAGPSILPREVIEDTAKAILDFNGSGLSLMEISHRAKDFQPVVDEAVALFKELLNIPEGYSVLFLGGGASLESVSYTQLTALASLFALGACDYNEENFPGFDEKETITDVSTDTRCV